MTPLLNRITLIAKQAAVQVEAFKSLAPSQAPQAQAVLDDCHGIIRELETNGYTPEFDYNPEEWPDWMSKLFHGETSKRIQIIILKKELARTQLKDMTHKKDHLLAQTCVDRLNELEDSLAAARKLQLTEILCAIDNQNRRDASFNP